MKKESDAKLAQQVRKNDEQARVNEEQARARANAMVCIHDSLTLWLSIVLCL